MYCRRPGAGLGALRYNTFTPETLAAIAPGVYDSKPNLTNDTLAAGLHVRSILADTSLGAVWLRNHLGC